MGVTGIFICKNCGNEFKASDGGGFHFTRLRCVDCGRVKDVERDLPDAPEKCDNCGGEMKDGLGPKCRKCGSRDTELKEPHIFYD